MNVKVLLETTIQIHRLADDPIIKKGINSALLGKDVYCTSFVLREFLRTIIADIDYIHSSVTKLGADGNGRLAMERLLRLLASGGFRFSIRGAQREQYIIAAILEKFRYSLISQGELLCYLEYVAQKWLRDFYRVPLPNDGMFEIRGDYFLTSLDQRNTEVLDWIKDGYPIPKPIGFPEGAAKFLNDHHDSVVAVLNAMRISDATLRDDRLVRFLEKLLSSERQFDFLNRLRVNSRGNWSLGDLLIALETPHGVQIYTDDHHYVLLASVLQKSLHPGPTPRALRQQRLI